MSETNEQRQAYEIRTPHDVVDIIQEAVYEQETLETGMNALFGIINGLCAAGNALDNDNIPYFIVHWIESTLLTLFLDRARADNTPAWYTLRKELVDRLANQAHEMVQTNAHAAR